MSGTRSERSVYGGSPETVRRSTRGRRSDPSFVAVVAGLLVAAVLGTTGPAAAQPRRVAGVSVMVTNVQPSGGGRTADFDVQLTTLSSDTEGCSCFPGLRGRAHAAKRAGALAGAPEALASPPIGHLGDYVTTGAFSSTYTYGPYSGTTTTRTAPHNAGTNRYISTYTYSTIVRYDLRYHVVGDGAVPAIDFGDGQTVPATTLPTLATSTTTVGGAVRRVFRGSFTHMYADQTMPHTIRVASAPNPTGGTPFTGQSLTAAAYPFHASTQVQTHFTASIRSTYGYRTIYHSSGSNSTTVNTRGPYANGPSPVFTTSNSYSNSGTFGTTGYPAQLVNTARVPGLAVIQVPAASSWGLLLLVGLLALTGAVLILRG